ncbi:hypothetical protein pipiens_009612, partial [Culex pipiens pipiens]
MSFKITTTSRRINQEDVTDKISHGKSVFGSFDKQHTKCRFIAEVCHRHRDKADAFFPALDSWDLRGISGL